MLWFILVSNNLELKRVNRRKATGYRSGEKHMLNEIIFELDLFLSNPDNLVALAYICGGAFLCLVATGMTNTIIIYRDVADFVWSLAIVLVPLGTLVALGMLAPEETEKAQNFFWETGQQRLISIIGALSTGIAVLKTLMNCLRNNGLLLGLVVFAFKVVAAVISVLVCLGVYNKLTEKNRSVKNVLVAVIIFGVFAFFVNRLINGDRVLKKRAASAG